MADVDRPLNERGKKTAPFMGGLMRRRQMLPEIIISSPALRARSTAALVIAGGSLDSGTVHDERIYEASANTLRQAVSEINDKFSSAMLIGHNPGMHDLASRLAHRNNALEIKLRNKFPTAAAAIFSRKDESSSWKLQAYVTPKDATD